MMEPIRKPSSHYASELKRRRIDKRRENKDRTAEKEHKISGWCRYFHGKRVIAADPFTMQIGVYEAEELRKKRYIAIERALDAKSGGG